MPTLPLFDPSRTQPGESHGVRAPGGYETWRFVAHDPSTQKWISVCFHVGFPSEEYLHRYQRFLRSPTRFAPPVPEESPAVRVLILSGDRPTSSVTRLPPVSPVGAGDTELNFEQFRFNFDGDGTIHLHAARIDLHFRPRSAPYQQEIALESNITRRWIISGVLYDVAGSVGIAETKKEFAGVGAFDQEYGSPPRSGHSFSGHLFMGDKALLFQQRDPMVIAKVSAQPLAIQSGIVGSAPPGRHYPRDVNLNGGPLLSSPRLIESTASSAWLLYEANFESEKGVCLCEVSQL